MASVTVPRSAVGDGGLPETCVVMGQPADGTVEVRSDSLPSWTWALLLVGVLPFLVAPAFASARVEGAVPVIRETVVRFHRRRRLSTVLLVAGGLGWVSAAWADVGWVWTYLSFVDGRPVRGGTHVRPSAATIVLRSARLSASRAAHATFLAVCVVGVLVLTLRPLTDDAVRIAILDPVAPFVTASGAISGTALDNVALFIPLGAALHLRVAALGHTTRPAMWALATGTALGAGLASRDAGRRTAATLCFGSSRNGSWDGSLSGPRSR